MRLPTIDILSQEKIIVYRILVVATLNTKVWFFFLSRFTLHILHFHFSFSSGSSFLFLEKKINMSIVNLNINKV